MKAITLITAAALAAALAWSSAALANPLSAARSAVQAPDTGLEQVTVRRRSVGVKRNIHRNVKINQSVNRKVSVPRILVRKRAWVRPARYWWSPGQAIAAGAAVGVATAPVARRWAGAAPSPAMCWFFTGQGLRRGFWDWCG